MSAQAGIRRSTAPLIVLISAFALLCPFAAISHAGDLAQYPELNLGLKPDPAKGYEILLNEVMAAPVLREADIDNLWKVWELELYAKAEAATPDERRSMTFERYGWARRLEADDRLPLGYTADKHGNLVTNCFVCHGGEVAGKTVPGAGNNQVDLTTLATDVRRLRSLENGGDPSSIGDVTAPFKTPLTIHKGTTNAVIFAFVFAGLRDPKLGLEYTKHPEKLLHHDMNPPAWWNFKKKAKIYCDAFAPGTPRQLMPFAMSPTFSTEKFHSFESNFVHIKAYIESIDAPVYPYPIDKALAKKGQIAFERVCTQCHGTYGINAEYPNKVVKIDRIGTDPRRHFSIARDRREATNGGWLQYYGEYPVDLESEGYLAQPLDGIWASAPYFHNGSVPTLHHVINIDERPKVWKRDGGEYDTMRVGLKIEEFEHVPDTPNSRNHRMYYDTSVPGSSAMGHTFPDDELDEEEKIAVLEYLKTL